MDNVLAKSALSESTSKQMENNSAKNFQNFIFELFEGNGLLSDLRAHLRGQIVTVLKSACNGDPIPSQKHLEQRLELKCQAINILIADYLLSLDFNYTLSVFVSELPLTNMMNSFSEYLQKLKVSEEISLQDNDVGCLLKFLGVNVDSENVSNIIQMYKIEKKPLLVCLFKIMCFYHKPSNEQAVSAKSSNTFKVGSSENVKENDCDDEIEERQKCKHRELCENCLEAYTTMNDKYKQKLNSFADIFKQVRDVYEAEMENLKSKENQKMERLIAVYVARNKLKRDELEQSFRQKQEALELNLSQKKKFLWEVARTLRSQHEKMSIAMKHVRGEDKRLTNKEMTLRKLLTEAEENIRQRGESIRAQISHELTAVNEQLDSIRQEKELLSRERNELEHMRERTNTDNDDDIHSRYVTLESELVALKQYLESKNSGSKSVVHAGTNTEAVGQNNSLLNNKDIYADERRQSVNPMQVVNDLKRDKNVNYDMLNKEDARTRMSSEFPNELFNNVQLSLGDENKLLKESVSQLQYQLKEMMTKNAKLQSDLIVANHTISSLRNTSRQPAASAERVEPFYLTLQRETASKLISRSGGGEELMVFGKSQPWIVLPGDTLPFLGVIGETSGLGSRMFRRSRKISIESQTKIAEAQPPSAPLTIRDEKQGSEDDLPPALLNKPTILSNLEPTSSNIRPKTSESRPNSTNPQLCSLGLRPNSIDLRPNSIDLRPNSTELRPNCTEIRPNFIEMRPKSTDLRPKFTDLRPNSHDMPPHSSYLRPNSPDLQTNTPNLRPNSPEIRPCSPEKRPNSPDMRSNLPGLRSNSPDMRPNLPELRPNSPELRPNSPELRPNSPELRPNSPNVRPNFPDLRPNSPNLKYNAQRHSEHTTTNKKQIAMQPILRSISSPDRKKSSNTNVNQLSPSRRRHRSPSTILREAKMRLRKLEIEAEAVELSYLDYKKRHPAHPLEPPSNDKYYDKKDLQKSATAKSNKGLDDQQGDHDSFKSRKHQHRADYQVTSQHNTDYTNLKHILADVTPVPDTHRTVQHMKYEVDYIKTPITDFRKLYAPSKITKQKQPDRNERFANCQLNSGKVDDATGNKAADNLELNILDNELNEMYDIEVALASPSAIIDFRHQLPDADAKHATIAAIQTQDTYTEGPSERDKEVVVHKESVDRALEFHNEMQGCLETYARQTVTRCTDIPTADFSVPVRGKQELTNIMESPEVCQSPPRRTWRGEGLDATSVERDKDGMSECYRNAGAFSEASLDLDSVDGERWSSASDPPFGADQ